MNAPTDHRFEVWLTPPKPWPWLGRRFRAAQRADGSRPRALLPPGVASGVELAIASRQRARAAAAPDWAALRRPASGSGVAPAVEQALAANWSGLRCVVPQRAAATRLEVAALWESRCAAAARLPLFCSDADRR